jgi:hypothetical protein
MRAVWPGTAPQRENTMVAQHERETMMLARQAAMTQRSTGCTSGVLRERVRYKTGGWNWEFEVDEAERLFYSDSSTVRHQERQVIDYSQSQMLRAKAGWLITGPSGWTLGSSILCPEGAAQHSGRRQRHGGEPLSSLPQGAERAQRCACVSALSLCTRAPRRRMHHSRARRAGACITRGRAARAHASLAAPRVIQRERVRASRSLHTRSSASVCESSSAPESDPGSCGSGSDGYVLPSDGESHAPLWPPSLPLCSLQAPEWSSRTPGKSAKSTRRCTPGRASSLSERERRRLRGSVRRMRLYTSNDELCRLPSSDDDPAASPSAAAPCTG